MNGERKTPERRSRKARRTRDTLAQAAFELVLDRGLRDVTVEEIAERADVDRRTFSRYFTSKEAAVLDSVRGDGDRINDALRARPAGEPPLTAYRRAVLDWLADPEAEAWHRRPRIFELLVLAEREPTLYAAFHHIRVDAQEDSLAIVADRLGVDPRQDIRPAVTVAAGAGALLAAQVAWVRGGCPDELPQLVEQAFDALSGELLQEPARPASHSTTEGNGTP
ncbi:TetR family transcriptional regulator [Streptomyces poriferorum]|uniref:TetR family transcriptional regulator n=1 Tax=Streptomyces poriferorum TaxID=2798799 RepID=A0ABY9J4N8_9ACTN|nr:MULTISPECIES: TetR family transcriptional regulator [unclassified Streptomyces]MDP5309677.1 TetR family transcriptional regulator [Streptomyces sp. Alt4]WLQ46266.1 TetR family transcriptional regulator [Streptomyces sp. Alt1]WLQ61137.1 TetR family transcriptional regulator [Streptomyces sp. Alt2]WSI61061.1 TetR family transcriptional regulator [Streptomyces sp. NBC_01336]